MKLLEKKKDFSGMRTIIQKRFNHWKTITLMQKQQITEKTQKTVVTKKRLNIKRSTDTRKKEEEKKSSQKDLKLSPEEEERRIKIRKFIESRIDAYEKTKSIKRKYFDIWLGRRSQTLITKETTTTNVVKKKRIYLVKEKTKPLLEDTQQEGAPGAKTDKLKRITTIAPTSNLSLTGAQNLIEKAAEKERRSSKTLNEELEKRLKESIGTKKKIKILKKVIGGKEVEEVEEIEEEEETLPTTEGDVTESKEDKLKIKKIKVVDKKKKKKAPKSIKTLKIKHLIENASRNQLYKYFKLWKVKTNFED